jgi:nicotinate-nucleotide adenylyltransferase
VHVGHLVAAVNARHALGLDLVLMVVANQPWQKVGARPLSPAADRLAVVEAAVEGVDGLEASRLEIDRGGLSYTADTLEELEALHPGAEMYLIVGSDLVGELSAWERVEEVRRRARLVVVNRPGVRGESPPGWSLDTVDIPALDVSSTDLRARAADGRPLDFLVPPAAIRRIRERRMYARAE